MTSSDADFEFDASDLPSAPAGQSEKRGEITVVHTKTHKPVVGGKGYDFKARARQLVDATVNGRAMERILRDPAHPQFMRALEFLADRGYGKVVAQVEVSTRSVVQLPSKDAEADYEVIDSNPDTPLLQDPQSKTE